MHNSSSTCKHKFLPLKLQLLQSIVILTFTTMLIGCQTQPPYDGLVRTVMPQYDNQNKQVLVSLPLPLDTIEVSRRSSGVITGSPYARSLLVNYATEKDFESILAIYDAFLINNGWELIERQENTFGTANVIQVTYVSETACIKIDNLNPYTTATPTNVLNYNVIIWHDFFSQPFSVPTPSGQNLCYDGGMCIPCPPS